MSYMGETWRNRPLPKDLDFSRTALVLVTGTSPNTCGHILLYIGGGFGHYFHFNGPSLFDYPRYMDSQSGYERFLKDDGKHELIRRFATIPHPDKAATRLHELLNRKWLSLLVSHNCAAFAGEVLRAGGNFYDMPDHCPVIDMGSQAFFESIFGPLRQKLGTQKAYEAKHVH